MKNGKYSNGKKRLNMKPLAVLLALTILVGCAVGGTLAWLMDTDDAVVNTFTPSTIDIELAETTGTSYKMVPGATISKDPKVTVKADSEACWLFVKLEKSANFDTFMTYEIASGWTELTADSGIYYREVGTVPNVIAADETFDILLNNTVMVKDTVTKAQMDALTSADAYPKLTITAYAVQRASFDNAADAWTQWSST